MRASMVTRPALDRFRPGNIDCESSKVNFNGQLPTLARNTATGAPGASTDLATMNKVSPAAALAFKAGAKVISPLTAVPDAAGAVAGVADAMGAGDSIGAGESAGTGGNLCARALAASAGCPRNSNDFASNSQSPSVPPPLASRDSKLAMALPIEPAADFGAGADAFVASAKTLVASLNALADSSETLVPAAAVGGAEAPLPSQWCNPNVAATISIAAADACHGRAGSVSKRGILRSRGSNTTKAARVVREPARNQNNGITILRDCLRPTDGTSPAARYLL